MADGGGRGQNRRAAEPAPQARPGLACRGGAAQLGVAAFRLTVAVLGVHGLPCGVGPGRDASISVEKSAGGRECGGLERVETNVGRKELIFIEIVLNL